MLGLIIPISIYLFIAHYICTGGSVVSLMPLVPEDHVYNRKSNNNIRVKGLFKETVKEVDPGYDMLSCVSPEHIRDEVTGKIRWYSLQKLFLEWVPEDPTEYKFAMDIFGSKKAWDRIQRHPMLKDKLTEWRSEVALRLRADGVRFMLDEVKSDGKNGFRAAQFLIDKGWLEKPKGKAGRPTKDETENKKKEDALLREALSEDAKRLGL